MISLWRRWDCAERTGARRIRPAGAVGVWEFSGVHCEDAVFAVGRSEAERRADWVDASSERYFAFGRRGFSSGDFGSDDADARIAEIFAGL